jgi:hypothetical protein
MSQINFIKGVIGKKKLTLGAQLRLNWEDWNFRRPNLIFVKSIEWNQEQNSKKIKVLGQIRVKLKKFTANDQYVKGSKL